jgi:hypothetical protein
MAEKRDADSSFGGGAPPGAKAAKTETQSVWVKVKGGNAVLYDADDLKNVSCVSKLLKMVKKEEKPKLDAVAVGELRLYKCEADAADPEQAVKTSTCFHDFVLTSHLLVSARFGCSLFVVLLRCWESFGHRSLSKVLCWFWVCFPMLLGIAV